MTERKTFWSRIEKFWNRSGVGVWNCDSGHLCFSWLWNFSVRVL